MTKNKKSGNYYNFLLFLLCFFLLFLLFRWQQFLLNKNYLQPGTYLETFTSDETINTTNSNNNIVPYDLYKVNNLHSNAIGISAFSKYTCNNWCGPQSQCLLSREQCLSDVDCKGCKDLTALNNFYDDSTSDIPKGANEDILCSVQKCNNSFAMFDKRD